MPDMQINPYTGYPIYELSYLMDLMHVPPEKNAFSEASFGRDQAAPSVFRGSLIRKRTQVVIIY